MKIGSTLSEVWYSFCPVASSSNLATANNMFQEEFANDGVRLSHISTLPLKEWWVHQTHRHERLFRDGGNCPPVWTKSEGVDTKVVGTIFVDRTKAIMVNKDSPIKSVTDLKGKKIALLRRLLNLVDFNRVNEKKAIIMSLKVHGLRADDVRFVDIPVNIGSIATEATLAQTPKGDIKPKTGWKLPQQPEVEALQRGEVDAIWASGGQEVVLEQAGIARVIYNLGQQTDLEYKAGTEYPFVCTVNTDFAREYPEFVVRWLKVMIRAGMWAKNHYDEVMKITAKATEVPEDAVRRSYARDLHQHMVPEVSERAIKALEIQKNFMKEHGFINNDCDLGTWVDGSFLEAAKKEIEAESHQE